MNEDTDQDSLPSGWTKIELAGHPCHIYEPPEPSEHNYTVLYLHGRYQGTPAEHPTMMGPFAENGLRIMAPLTRRSWWADRICPDFDSEITAEQYVLKHVVPYIENEWDCQPPRLALMGASMGGQGALRMAYKYPNQFPVVTAFFPSIDYQIRIEEGDRILSKMYKDVEGLSPGYRDVAHSSSELAQAPVVLLRPRGCPLARIGRTATIETLLARGAPRIRPRNVCRRSHLGVCGTHDAPRRRVHHERT